MSGGDPFGSLSDEDARALSNFRQGEIIEGVGQLHVTGHAGPTAFATPLGVVVVSQTCDVVIRTRPTIQVAPRVRLGHDHAREARDGKRPRYVHLSGSSDDEFVDLEVIATVARVQLAGLDHRAGVSGDDQTRRFATAVARRFGRFAFPDLVTPWLRPLEQSIRSRATKPNSPEGQILDEVVEFRIEAARGWREPPYSLTLCVVVRPGSLPLFPNDELPPRPTQLAQWLDFSQPGASEIAEKLVDTDDPADRYWLWMALYAAWATRCRPPSSAPSEVVAAVSEITGEVVAVDEFPLSRVRRSEISDLDHLSEPAPGL